MALKIKDLSNKSGKISHYAGADKSNLKEFNVTMYKALIIGSIVPASSTQNPGINFIATFVGGADMRVNNTAGVAINSSTYNEIYTNVGSPTRQEFLNFYEDCYYYSIGFSRQPYAGKTDLYVDVDCSDVFIGNGLETSGEVTTTRGTATYLINVSGTYSFDEYLDTVSNLGILHEAVKYSIPSPIIHEFWVNGGELGTDKNYTIQEVIREDTDGNIRWVSSSKSLLGFSGTDTTYTTDSGQETLDTSRDSGLNKVKTANGIDNLTYSVITTGLSESEKAFFVELRAEYLDKTSGSKFSGTKYKIKFKDTLPANADDVNNTWAEVTQIGEVTSANNEVIVKYGEPPYPPTPDEQQREDIQNNGDDNKGGNDDTDSKKPSANDFTWGTDVGSVGELTKLYEISSAQLKLFGEELWSQTYEDVLRIQDNPIENVISIKKFPFSIGGISENVKIGNITFGCTADKIGKGTHRINFNLGKRVNGYYGNFLDYEPFTTLKIFLPYCGVYDLPISECMKKTISVSYLVDLVHGDCLAIVFLDNIPMYEFKGSLGINVPLTQTDRVSAETKHIQNMASSVIGGAMSGGVAGAVMSGINSAVSSGLNTYNASHTASGSGAVNFLNKQDIVLYYDRPQTITKTKTGYLAYPKNYGHTHGYPLNEVKRIGSLTKGSFFKAGNNIDLSNIKANEEIKERIKNKLQSGVYV